MYQTSFDGAIANLIIELSQRNHESKVNES
jgi:hypothetical protein